MVKLVFAGNRPTFERFLKYFQIKDIVNYTFVSGKHSMMGLNHVNCQYILTDGYAVNPGFGTDRYIICKQMAEKDNKKDFIIKMMMHEKIYISPNVKLKETNDT